MDVVILNGVATTLSLAASGHRYPFLRAHAWILPVGAALGCLLAVAIGPTGRHMRSMSFRANALVWGAAAVLCLGIAAFMVIRKGI